uniref:CSON006614 protein n=1 Tax=Culicoides sonorensis TaxID=179676 RepID=A0A336MV18_CULSO
MEKGKFNVNDITVIENCVYQDSEIKLDCNVLDSSGTQVPKNINLNSKESNLLQNSGLKEITNHLYYPKPMELKRKRKAPAFPSAISSGAWREMYEQREVLKKLKAEPKQRGRPKRKLDSQDEVSSKKVKLLENKENEL